MEKVLNNYKGVILFYVFIVLISLLITFRVDDINSQANAVDSGKTVESYYA